MAGLGSGRARQWQGLAVAGLGSGRARQWQGLAVAGLGSGRARPGIFGPEKSS